MAEAVVDRRNKFYCHQCSREIEPTIPEFTCPQCDSGFIEEMSEEEHQEQNMQPENADPAAHFAEMWGRTFLDSFRLHANPDGGHGSTPPQEGESSTERRTRPNIYFGRTHPNRQPQPMRNPAIENIIHQLISGLTGGQSTFFGTGGHMPGMVLHANPGDYAWGVGGLDRIITQLMNQLEGSGAPPAEQAKIDALPTVEITPEQEEKIMQCSVCMEDYKTGEEVRQLPCAHLYHNDCIVPWLKQHGTCPVCRKNLEGKEYTDEPGNMSLDGDPSFS